MEKFCVVSRSTNRVLSAHKSPALAVKAFDEWNEFTVNLACTEDPTIAKGDEVIGIVFVEEDPYDADCTLYEAWYEEHEIAPYKYRTFQVIERVP